MSLIRRRGEKENERGSLALEQVLFIGAIVAMSAGVYTFYGDLYTYFSTFQIEGAPKLSNPAFGSSTTAH